MIIDQPIVSGSFNVSGSSNLLGNVAITGSLTVSEGISISGSILSASFATTASNAPLYLLTSSFESYTSSINSVIKSKLDTEGVVSGSIQVQITGTTGYSTFSSSISSSIGNLSSSVATTTNTLSSSVSSSIGSLSSSVATTTSTLSSSVSSSIGSLSSSVATTTSNLSGSINSLSGSVSSSIGDLSSSIATTTNNLSSSFSSSLGSLSSSISSSNSTQDGRLNSLEGVTGSYATTGSNLFKGTQTISGSIIPAVDNTYDLGSPTNQFRDLYLSSASLYIDGTKVLSSNTQELQITTDNGQSIKILEAGSDNITLQSADGNIELKSSGDGDVLLDPTNGKIVLKGTTEIFSGNKIQSSINGTPVVFASDVIVSGGITTTGQIIAQSINVQQVTSSIIYSSGSNQFGNDLLNIQTLTGSVNITGSLKLNNSNVILTNQTGSMSVATSSLALTASYVGNAETASYILQGVSSSYATTASFALNVPVTASFANQALSSSYSLNTTSASFASQALTSSYSLNGLTSSFASQALSSSYAVTASFSLNVPVTASYSNEALTSSYSLNALTASYLLNVPATASYASQALSSSFASTASFALNVPVTSSFANEALSSSFATNALTASHLLNAPATASYASQALSSSYATTASFSLNVPVTASYANEALTSSYATTASFSLSGTGFPFSGSATITGSLLITNLTGSGVRYMVADANGNISSQTPGAVIKSTQQYTATAGQSTYNVTNGYTTGLVDVFVNGTKLSADEFVDTSGTSVVITGGVESGSIVEIVKYLPSAGVTNNTLRQLTTFNITSNQSTFNVDYTPGLLDVFYNGARLSSTDYTAANGTSILFATASVSGDTVDVITYSYQVGSFSGIGGGGTSTELSYFNTQNSITSSENLKFDGSNLVITGSIISTQGFTGSFSGTASYANNSNLLDGLDSLAFVQTGSFQTYTSSFSSSVATTTLNLSSSLSSSIGDLSSSVATTTSGLSSSVATTTLNLSSSVSNSIGSLSGSVATTTLNLSSSVSSSIGSLSSSIATTTSGLGGRITTIESNYATTGSNVFVGSQVITGSLYITTDLIVQGSSSLQNITASAVSIGTNTVILNTDTPAVRFAGISVQDSGSNVGVTGSIFWDGLCNRWVYSNPSGIGYSGGLLISGPRNVGTLGDEVGTTACALMVGQGGDHITSSDIFNYSGVTCFYGTSYIKSTGGAYYSGNVGIGTENAVANLTLKENESCKALVLYGRTSDNLARIDFYRADETCFSGRIQIDNGTTSNMSIRAQGNIRLQTGGSTDRLTISNTGDATFSNKLGVGGASSTYSLTAYNACNGTTVAFGGTTHGIRIDNGGDFSCGRSTIFGVDYTFYGTYQPLSIEASTLILQNITGGNVGIGTLTTNEKLQVAGAISATGTATTAFASSSTLDWFSTGTRIISRGANTTTKGTFTIKSESSDGSNTLNVLSFSNVGAASFACELTAKTIGTNDLKLNNLNYECANYVDGTRGSWLIQEGENDLFIINQISCKKYKFNLIEIK
jgi:hypothetical protein